MKTIVAVVLMLAFALLAAAQPPVEFTTDNKLRLPANYREWVYLSSGLGMTYGPASDANRGHAPWFDNVFVNPSAYRSFLETGKWPEKTAFVLEIRSAVEKGSINNAGHFQGELVAIEMELKDSARFGGDGWSFYAFGKSDKAAQIPKTAACYTCHPQKGAVDNTFVQFYPTLLKIAKEKGTLNPGYVAAEAAEHP